MATVCNLMQGICQRRHDNGRTVRAASLQVGDTILPVPNNGPYGPWLVTSVDVHPINGVTIRTDNGEVWFNRPADSTYRVERAS